MVRVLVIATGAIAMIYVLMNLAYLNILGLDGICKRAVRSAPTPSGRWPATTARSQSVSSSAAPR